MVKAVKNDGLKPLTVGHVQPETVTGWKRGGRGNDTKSEELLHYHLMFFFNSFRKMKNKLN